MNPEFEIQNILSQKGLKKAPESLLPLVESAIAARQRSGKRRWAYSITALAAGLIIGVTLFVSAPDKAVVNTALNAAYIDGIFRTCTASETTEEPSYPLLTLNNDDILSVLNPENETTDFTLVDF